MKQILCCIIGIIGLAGAAFADVTTYRSASTAGKFLAVPAGARPAGLGDAFTGVRGDVNAIYWNPAGLLGIPDHRLQLSHHSWIQGINSEYLLYAQPVENFGAVGAACNYLNYGSIERWNMDVSGNPIPTGESYTPYALSGVVAWAVPVGTGLVAGAGLKLAYEQIDNSGSLAGGVDVGLNYAPTRDLAVGAVVRNLGVAAGEMLLPLALGLGLAYNLPYSFTEKDMITFLLDAEVKYDESPVGGLGVEYSYADLFQVRAGWNSNFGHSDPDRLGLTGGLGLRYRQWGLDYAIAPQGNLGLSHQVSLQYGF